MVAEFDVLKYRKQGRAACLAGNGQSCSYTDGTEAYAGWRAGYEDAKRDLQLGIKSHSIARDEWVRRFKARIAQQLDLAGEDDSIPANELKSWPEQDEYPVSGFPHEWTHKMPERAADENLSYWTD